GRAGLEPAGRDAAPVPAGGAGTVPAVTGPPEGGEEGYGAVAVTRAWDGERVRPRHGPGEHPAASSHPVIVSAGYRAPPWVCHRLSENPAAKARSAAPPGGSGGLSMTTSSPPGRRVPAALATRAAASAAPNPWSTLQSRVTSWSPGRSAVSRSPSRQVSGPSVRSVTAASTTVPVSPGTARQNSPAYSPGPPP